MVVRAEQVNVSRRFQCSSIIRHTLPISVPDAMMSRVLMFWLRIPAFSTPA